MKIIHQGTDPDTIPQVGTCTHCRTQVEFLPHEATFRSDQRDGDYYELGCPTCKHLITVAKRRPNFYEDH
jgi:hypothetical protein